jgi:DNA/RNA-binding protein KIN17
MRLFAENPNSVLDEFSRDFEKGFMDTLSRGHGTKRILSNKIYQEYIADKHHIHMNATVWTTLTGFVKYLGKEGKCVVDETEKGWFIQYIDRDPKMLARQMRADERKQADVDDEDRMKKEIELQVRAAEERLLAQPAAEAVAEEEEQTALEGAEPKSVSMALGSRLAAKKRPRIGKAAFGMDEEDEAGEEQPRSKRPSALSQLIQESRRAAPPVSAPVAAPASCWLRKGIVVKVAEGEHEGRKATVKAVRADSSAELALHSSSAQGLPLLVLPQRSLQTVVPRAGERALLVRAVGAVAAGGEVRVLALDEQRGSCELRLLSSGQLLRRVSYDDICRLEEV